MAQAQEPGYGRGDHTFCEATPACVKGCDGGALDPEEDRDAVGRADGEGDAGRRSDEAVALGDDQPALARAAGEREDAAAVDLLADDHRGGAEAVAEGGEGDASAFEVPEPEIRGRQGRQVGSLRGLEAFTVC